MKARRRLSLFARVVALAVTVATAAAMLVAGEGVTGAAEGSWAATGSLNTPRIAHQYNLLNDGQALVSGGRTDPPLPTPATALTSAELYNPVSELFTLTGAMATSRWSHTATLLPDGRLLAAGGFTGVNSNVNGVAVNAQSATDTAEVYDPVAGTWTTTPPMVTRRALHVAELLTSGPNAGKVLVAGGRTCDMAPPAVCDFTFRTDLAELYDPVANTWAPTGPMNKPRHTTSAAPLLDGRVLVPAGFSSTADAFSTDNTADLYDPATGTFSLTSNLNRGRARQGAMLLTNGTVLVGPGSRQTVCGPPVCMNGGPPFSATLNTTSEFYDPATNTWTTTAGSPVLPGRFNFHQTVLPNGKALMAGGFGGPVGNETVQRSAEVYDPATGIWTSAGTMSTVHGSVSSQANTQDAVVLTVNCGANCGKALVVGDNGASGVADLYTPGPAGTPVRATKTKVACAQATVGPNTLTCAAMTGENEPSGNSQTGTVGFFLDAINSPGFIGQCTLGPLAPGLSRCSTTTSAIPAGPHTVWALYFGDSLYSASVGSDDVGNPPSGPPEPSDTKVLCAPLFPSPTNVAFRCAALVADDDADVSAPAPTAQVGFFRDAINSPSFVGQCTLAPLAGAISACTVQTAASTPPGPHIMWGLYFGDGVYTASVDSDPVTA